MEDGGFRSSNCTAIEGKLCSAKIPTGFKNLDFLKKFVRTNSGRVPDEGSVLHQKMCFARSGRTLASSGKIFSFVRTSFFQTPDELSVLHGKLGCDLVMTAMPFVRMRCHCNLPFCPFFTSFSPSFSSKTYKIPSSTKIKHCNVQIINNYTTNINHKQKMIKMINSNYKH